MACILALTRGGGGILYQFDVSLKLAVYGPSKPTLPPFRGTNTQTDKHQTSPVLECFCGSTRGVAWLAQTSTSIDHSLKYQRNGCWELALLDSHE